MILYCLRVIRKVPRANTARQPSTDKVSMPSTPTSATSAYRLPAVSGSYEQPEHQGFVLPFPSPSSTPIDLTSNPLARPTSIPSLRETGARTCPQNRSFLSVSTQSPPPSYNRERHASFRSSPRAQRLADAVAFEQQRQHDFGLQHTTRSQENSSHHDPNLAANVMLREVFPEQQPESRVELQVVPQHPASQGSFVIPTNPPSIAAVAEPESKTNADWRHERRRLHMIYISIIAALLLLSMALAIGVTVALVRKSDQEWWRKNAPAVTGQSQWPYVTTTLTQLVAPSATTSNMQKWPSPTVTPTMHQWPTKTLTPTPTA